MATLVDYMLGLFNNPETAEAFIKDPDEALGAAGLADVPPDQLQAVAASVSPIGLTLGDLNPIEALQRAVSTHHGIEAGFDAPEPASAQDWASTAEAAEGRFGVGFDAVDSGAAPAPGGDAPADSVLLPYFDVDLNDAQEPAPAQDWASTAEAAEGRFGVGFDAVDSGAAPAPGGDAPADSVLLPYFDVDLNDAQEPAPAQEWTSTAEAAEGRFGVGFDAVDSGAAPAADSDSDAPADSVLLPYFEADLEETPESGTLFQDGS